MPEFLGFGERSCLEQRVGGAAVAGGESDFALAAADFRFQSGDTFFEFGNRQRVQILPDQISQRIIAAQRQIFVAIHITYFDRTALAVNTEAA
jgi:hypothetical protein